MSFVVCAIYNLKHDKFYIGQTKYLEERLNLYNQGILGGYTSRFDGKWELIYKELAKDRMEALKREKQLKNYRGREFIKQFIPG